MSCSDNEDGVETVGIDPDDEIEEEEVEEVEEVVEDEEEGPDPSQMLEINQDYADESGNRLECQVSMVKEEHDEIADHSNASSAPPKGLLEMALTMDRPRDLQQQQQSQDHPVHLPLMPLPDFDPAALERRALNQAVNSKPRDLCPICGDKANGIHYGIYTCEGCKNFFKRSVTVVSAGKPYVCKEGAMNCSVSLYELDGVTRRRTRCQFCRYQACMDAGMVYNGRVTGNRSNKSNGGTPTSANAGAHAHSHLNQAVADNSFSSSNSLPVYGGEEYNEEQEEEEAEVLCPTIDDESSTSAARSALHQVSVECLHNELQLMESRVRELETSVAEKDRQLELQRTQIANLKQQCALNERLQQMEQAEGEAGVGMVPGVKRPRLDGVNMNGGGHGVGGRATASGASFRFRTPPSATSSPLASRSSFPLL